MQISFNPIQASLTQQIKQALRIDEWGKTMIRELQSKDKVERAEDESLLIRQYSYKDELLRWNRKIYLPAGKLRTETLQRYHNIVFAAHQGASKTLEVVRRYYYWPEMSKDVAEYTQACLECQRNKKEPGFLHPLPIPSERFQDIAMDWTKISGSVTGQNTALIIFDRLTKLTVLVSTHDTDTAEHTAELLIKHWICRGMGVPQTITSDRDGKFGASILKTIMNRLEIKHNIATARHQRTHGQTENMFKQAKTALTKLFDQGETKIETLLPYLEFALNNSVNQTTGFTPFYLAYGYHQQEFADMDLLEEQDREYDLEERMAWNISKTKEVALETQNH
jgi:hypothetical protein